MTSFQAVIAEVRSLKDTLRQKRGTLVGIECKQGQFAVTETRKEGRKSVLLLVAREGRRIFVPVEVGNG